MKTPRIHDFDPNATIPELRSPLEGMPSIHKPVKPEPAQATSSVASQPVPPVPLVRDVLPVPLTKRMMKQRHPFDIYQDQYESLQRLALEERKQGGIGSMSAMVRAALDTFIAARTKK